MTVLQSSYAALVLVHVVVGGGRPGHDTDRKGKAKPSLDLAETFDSYALEVRNGADPLAGATAYLPRNHTARRKRVIGTLLAAAAAADGPDDAVRALLALCHHTDGRKLDSDDNVISRAGDRQTALQARWRKSLLEGAWLLGLRGANRCLGCECKLSTVKGRHVRRMEVSDRPGGRQVEYAGRREDYCSACSAVRKSSAGRPLLSKADAVRATHNERIRTVLDAAEPAIRPHGDHIEHPLHEGPLPEPWPLAKREAWLASRGTT